jgi:hypothetical protein
VAFIPPYPFYLDDPNDFTIGDNIDDLWYGRLQLLFSCTLCRKGYAAYGQPNRQRPGAIEVDLAFISTFEPLPNAPQGPTQRAGCDILYQPRRLPTLYISFMNNVITRAPLFPCFLDGNSSPTIPYSRRAQNNKDAGLLADTSRDKGDGTLIFELNMWIWRFGRGVPRQVSVQESMIRRAEAGKSRCLAAAATRKRRREETNYAAHPKRPSIRRSGSN